MQRIPDRCCLCTEWLSQNRTPAIWCPPVLPSPIRRHLSIKEVELISHLVSPLMPVTESVVSSAAPQATPFAFTPIIHSIPPAFTSQPAISPSPTIPSLLASSYSPAPTTPSLTPVTVHIVMSASKGISGMPSPTSGKAPHFTGVKTELLDFLELFEDLASSNGLTDEEKCKNIVRYVNQCTKRFWVLLPGYISRDFADFKKSILAKYPGAEKGIHYTCRDLERLVANSADSGLSTETELMEYYYDFLPIATWLVDNKKISETQRDQYFWEGLPVSAQTTIDRRLELKLPDYSRDEPPAFEKVLEAGRFVFSDKAFHADNPLTARLNAIRNEERSITNARAKRSSRVRDDSDDEDAQRTRDAPREVQTKRVAFTPPPAPAKATTDEVEALARQMHGLDIGDVAYSGCYT